MMIQGDSIIFKVDHRFDQNNWALCKDKIFMCISINGEPLNVIISVAAWVNTPPLISIGHDGLNKYVIIIPSHLGDFLYNDIVRPEMSKFSISYVLKIYFRILYFLIFTLVC